ncbi:hypothetical protein LMG27952_07059 [Paraburkholderia hiiakae]|uniref:Uncharacterized protein n=1 Tax=Paraburkholderia hiiakae TaxID=1081782 RepID=A0ABM8P9U1_9BURK|nr:hypothetical protein [Paraburkholderia hiiakae]CAD6560166.1 hypothetical protein LMG27952_07059 [Paraburkholderia hiiakae]
MKRILLSALIFAVAQSVKAECTINSIYQGLPAKVLQENGWNFQNYNIVCEKLRRANASVVINGTASVLTGTSLGWATLSVADKKTGLGISDYYSANTETNTYASQDKAEELLYVAINTAANNWKDLDSALAILDEKRRKLGIAR